MRTVAGKRARVGFVAVIAVLVCISASRLEAASASANLATSATIGNNCTISTAAIAFGAYDPVGANAAADLDASGSLTVACTRGASATVGLALGANASGATRRMANGSGGYLTYELYQDAGRSTVWSDSGSGLYTPAAAPSKAPRVFTVYGRIPSNQDQPAGGYSDTVTATVNF